MELETILSDKLIGELLPFQSRKLAPYSSRPLSGGSNNRIYAVVAGQEEYVFKCYFRHPDDMRDRLHAEFSFSSFAWNHGIRCIAEPVTRDDHNLIGVYRFVRGRKVVCADINAYALTQALDFICALNQHRGAFDAKALPSASDSSFSVGGHIGNVQARMEKLKGICPASEIESEALAFIKGPLQESWEAAKLKARKEAEGWGYAIDQEVPASDIVISPSDFGFHNAIVGENGSMRFIDFEYAGWDDLAKLTCDFFGQVAMPVPPSYWSHFSKRILELASDPEDTMRRIALLLPIHRIKWCCIVLNYFLACAGERKQFADQQACRQKAQQLHKAKLLLSSLDQFTRECLYGVY